MQHEPLNLINNSLNQTNGYLHNTTQRVSKLWLNKTFFFKIQIGSVKLMTCSVTASRTMTSNKNPHKLISTKAWSLEIRDAWLLLS